MNALNHSLQPLLDTDTGVATGYQHQSKYVTPLDPLFPAGSVLKWYSLHLDSHPIPDEVTQLARQALHAATVDAPGLGFAVLHRCGEDFYFLIVCTWRQSNELWQTVLYKDGPAASGFTLFPRDVPHKPTLCVWELVPVEHERQAWLRFLRSARDEDAAQAWLADSFSGIAG
jgi:hypothetical protein